jgi:hypothetical protein
MSASVRQEIAGSITLASATTVAGTFASACLVGSTIEVWVTSGSATQPSGVADSASQTYTSQATGQDGSNPTQLNVYTFQNNASNTALTVTATWAATEPIRAIWLREITGVGSAPFQAAVITDLVSPGVGADAAQTTPVAGTAPFFASCFAYEVLLANSAGSVGTGYTLGALGWQSGGSGANFGISENQVFLSSASVIGSVGPGSPLGTDRYLIGVALYTSLCPNLTTLPANQPASTGKSQTVTFTVAATASAGSLTYQWYKNGVSVGAGGTSASYSPTVSYPADVSSYWYVIVTDSNGSAQSNNVGVLFGLEGRFAKRSPGLFDDGSQDYKSELILLRWF